MAKAKWIIEPSVLTIYPKRNLRIIGLVFLIIIIVFIFFLLKGLQGVPAQFAILYFGFLLLIPLFVVFMAESKIIFDGRSRKLYKKIAFLPAGSIAFEDIAAVEPYQIIGSGFSYRAFRKSNRHGKGLIVSPGYNKSSDPNLIKFQQEVLPKIDELVFANAPVLPKQTIYEFNFFKEEGGVYTIRDNKIGSFVIGIIMIGISVAILLNPNFMADEETFKRLLTTYFPLIIGLVFLFGFFSSIRFDKNQRKVLHSTFAGRVVKEYPFDDLIRFQIVRKTTNFVYSGTEVRAEFNVPSKNKITTLMIKNFRGTKKIDRFIDEANTILGRI